jgi:hypothetical protein
MGDNKWTDLVFQIGRYAFYRGDVSDVSFGEVVNERHLQGHADMSRQVSLQLITEILPRQSLAYLYAAADVERPFRSFSRDHHGDHRHPVHVICHTVRDASSAWAGWRRV